MPDLKVVVDLNARVWKIEVAVGDQVAADDVLIILETMKTEIPIETPKAGRVKAILVAEEDQVREGQVVAIIET